MWHGFFGYSLGPIEILHEFASWALLGTIYALAGKKMIFLIGSN
jgi:hypothetical protein